MNAGLKKISRVGAYFVLKVIRDTVKLRCTADRISGLERHSGEQLSILYIGHEKRNREFLIDKLFAVADIIERNPPVHPIAGLALAQRARVDVELIIVDLNFPYSLLYSSSDSLRIPQWIKQKVVLPLSKEEFVQCLPRKLRREVFRCIRKYNYTYEIIETEQAFTDFYRRFYVPFIESRFGTESLTVSESFFLSECRLGSLLRLFQCGVPIAGAIIQRLNTQLSSVWVGFCCDHGSTISTGASDVLDYFTLEYALREGCRSVDFGPSRPLLNDGVFRYKRKWEAQAQIPRIPSGDILLRPVKFNEAVKSVFKNNFWITREQDSLVGYLLVEGQSLSAEELQDIARNCGSGIDSIKLRSCVGFNSAIVKAAESVPGISLIN